MKTANTHVYHRVGDRHKYDNMKLLARKLLKFVAYQF